MIVIIRLATNGRLNVYTDNRWQPYLPAAVYILGGKWVVGVCFPVPLLFHLVLMVLKLCILFDIVDKKHLVIIMIVVDDWIELFSDFAVLILTWINCMAQMIRVRFP